MNPSAVTEPSGTGILGVFTGSTTVRAFFTTPDAAGFDEYLVKAGINGATTTTQLGVASRSAQHRLLGATAVPCGGGGVTSTTTGFPNTPGSAPIGGNTGGHSIGFSTAPEAFSTTFDTLTNTASVTFDQRTYAPAAGALATTSAAEAANSSCWMPTATRSHQRPTSTRARRARRDSPAPPGVRSRLARVRPAVRGKSRLCVPHIPVTGGPGGNAKAIEIRGRLGAITPFKSAAIGGDVFNTASDPAAAGNLQQIVSPIRWQPPRICVPAATGRIRR